MTNEWYKKKENKTLSIYFLNKNTNCSMDKF